ncbi:DUF3592 domain-containing protein [Kitasatospora sp. NPDC093806]|uniref:DUF3592 domain-containing protein n=1 Tax=Kitasatospora sp. NPDC093806 TaxID=3155075 RepID=UPI003422B99F
MTTRRRVSGPRKFLVLVLGGFALLGGWLLGTGHLRAFAVDACTPGPACDDRVTALFLTTGMLLSLVTLFGVLGLAENREVEKPERLPLGAATAAALALGLLGAVPANGVPHPWLFTAIGPLAVLTLAAGVRGERRIRRENAEHQRGQDLAARLHFTGVTVLGTVTEVRSADRGPRDREQRRLRLTIGYTGPDGRPHTLGHTGAFPVYALPAAGGRIPVRHDPQDPSTAVVPLAFAPLLPAEPAPR